MKLQVRHAVDKKKRAMAIESNTANYKHLGKQEQITHQKPMKRS